MLKYILGLVPLSIFAQNFEADTVQARELIIDQDSLHANLWFEPELGLVHGSLDLYIDAIEITDSIWLDAKPSVQVEEEILFNGSTVVWKRYKNGLAMFPQESWKQGRVQLEFTSRPFKGVYFNGWNDETGRAPRQIFTQGQGIDHRHWLPHVDAQNDKLKTSLSIRFDNGYQVLANGSLIEKVVEGDHTEWTYALNREHSSYLIAFVVGEYEEIVSDDPDIHRSHFIYPDETELEATTYHVNDQIWDYLNQRIGVPFPWSAYRQVPVQDFPHGGMENTTLTIYTDNFVGDKRSFTDLNYIYVNAHELAHHWFGNWVTVPSAHDFWIHEGFATYYQMETEREVLGPNHYTVEWIKAHRLMEQAYARDNFPLRHGRAGTFRFYQMGGLIVRAIEHEMRTRVFDQAVRDFLVRYGESIVTTDSLRISFEHTCRCELDSIFNAYLDQPHFPRLTVEFNEEKSGWEFFLGDVNGNTPNFLASKVPIRVWGIDEGQEFYTQIEVTMEEGIVATTTSKDEMLFYEVDPDHFYPIQIKLKMSDEQWMNALKHGSLRTQHLAVAALRDVDWEEKEEAYHEVLMHGHWSVVDSIVNQLVQSSPRGWDKKILELLDYRKEQKIKDIVARRLKTVPSRLMDPSMVLLAEASYNSSVALFFTLINSDPSGIADYLEPLDGVQGGRTRNVELYRAYITYIVKGENDSGGLPILLDRAGPSYSKDVRLLAWELLSAREYQEKDLRMIQYEALASRNRHIRNAAARYSRSYMESENEEIEIDNIQFALRGAHPDDIARVERILDIDLEGDE